MISASSKPAKDNSIIYIVDDDDGMRRALTALMTTVGYSPVEIHRSNVMEKMGARSVAHLVKMHLLLNGAA